MYATKRYIALICVALLMAPAGSFAADPPSGKPNSPDPPNPQPVLSQSRGFWDRVLAPYRPRGVTNPSAPGSHRLDALLRGGNLYLSLADAIALTLENNLDIAIQRYSPQIADANLLHASAGGYAAPVSTSVFAGPGSVASAGPSSGLQALLVPATTQIGPVTPNLDPNLTGGAGWSHTTAPQSNTIVTGTSALVQRQDTSNFGVQKNLLTGTIMSLGLTNSSVFTNSSRSSLSPATTAGLSLSVTQHLLMGYGPAVNSRQIRIARNNRELSDLTFKAQVIATVAAAMDLYWDLVSYNENVRVKKDAKAADEKLLVNNRAQVAVGTLAPISVAQAEAEVAADEQAEVVAETQLLQQETILKNVLTGNGLMNPMVASARIIPTDSIHVPDVEAITPLQDAMAMAESARPELSQFRILLQNQQIANRGTRNELLPTLDVVGTLTNNALAGTLNPLFTGAPPAFFTGGYGTVLSQLFARNFPNYSIGFNLSVPLRNRAAQADLINGELNLRQQQLGLQRMENQVRVEVQNAVIALQQARAQYQASVKQRVLEEQTVDAEQKKLEMGVSTTYNVILTQRDLVTAQSNEVAAESAYAKARVEMDRTTGQTLYSNNISMDEAVRGTVARPPSAIPPVPPAPQPPPASLP